MTRQSSCYARVAYILIEARNVQMRLVVFLIVFWGLSPETPVVGQDLQRVLASYEEIYNSIKTWQGEVEVKGDDNPRRGRFVFDRTSSGANDFGGNFFSRLDIETSIGVLREGQKEPDMLPHKTQFEALLIDNEIITVDHSSMRTKVEGFDFELGADERPFTLGEKTICELKEAQRPLTYFCPTYMFHGPTPHPRYLVKLAAEEQSDFSVESLASGGVRMIVADLGLECQFVERESSYVLTQFRHEDTVITWDWESYGSYLYPAALHVVEPQLKRDITFILRECRINESIPEERFDPDMMNFVRGDILADRTQDKLFRYDGTTFVDLADYGKPQRRIQNFGLLLVVLGVITAGAVLGRRFLRARDAKM